LEYKENLLNPKDFFGVFGNVSSGFVMMISDKKTKSWYIARHLLDKYRTKIMRNKDAPTVEFDEFVSSLSDEAMVAMIAKFGITAPERCSN